MGVGKGYHRVPMTSGLRRNQPWCQGKVRVEAGESVSTRGTAYDAGRHFITPMKGGKDESLKVRRTLLKTDSRRPTCIKTWLAQLGRQALEELGLPSGHHRRGVADSTILPTLKDRLRKYREISCQKTERQLPKGGPNILFNNELKKALGTRIFPGQFRRRHRDQGCN